MIFSSWFLAFDPCHANMIYSSMPSHLLNSSFLAEMSNQELIHAGTKAMDETDQAIENSKKVDYIILLPFLSSILLWLVVFTWKIDSQAVDDFDWSTGCWANNWSWSSNSGYLEGSSKKALNPLLANEKAASGGFLVSPFLMPPHIWFYSVINWFRNCADWTNGSCC